MHHILEADETPQAVRLKAFFVVTRATLPFVMASPAQLDVSSDLNTVFDNEPVPQQPASTPSESSAPSPMPFIFAHESNRPSFPPLVLTVAHKKEAENQMKRLRPLQLVSPANDQDSITVNPTSRDINPSISFNKRLHIPPQDQFSHSLRSDPENHKQLKTSIILASSSHQSF